MKRRRFIKIMASATACCALPSLAFASTQNSNQWHGVALGAKASLYIDHPDASRLIKLAHNEILRLEKTFSLYLNTSVISQLNRKGYVEEVPFELLELLSLAQQVHNATNGYFDPTIQPVWQLYAQRAMQGRRPTSEEISAVHNLVGFESVEFNAQRVAFQKPGMALTFNGIAQGFIADKVKKLLVEEGLENALIETGEIYALGHKAGSKPWRVGISNGGAKPVETIALSNQAVATSSPNATLFSEQAGAGHILNPQNCMPGDKWQLISVTDSSAAIADALSTALCLMDEQSTQKALEHFPNARLVVQS
ncbi:FAD:protein FMN transferase [Polycladidibacter stylochi]|uniref:FAD:protein FMN transferase n=1 Tax=Polycladidibacter stylochi TaxID=1807766 RepID=UPI000835BD44|nr:FAD:protein FMN transferase [Pseudovibrio stylochi]